jgi:hypothetical protein
MRFIPTGSSVKGWGFMPFNASITRYLPAISNQILIEGTFIDDQSRVIDTTPDNLLSVPCKNGPMAQSDTRCERTFLIPGGVDYAASQFVNDSSSSEFFLAESQQSLAVKFVEGEPSWTFGDTDCRTFGFPFAAFRICIQDEATDTIRARTYLTCCAVIYQPK